MTVEELALQCRHGFVGLVSAVSVVHAERTVRVHIRDGSFLDIFVGRTGRYSYHWQASAGPYRFDNAPHFGDLVSHPHHLHMPDGSVVPSPIRGVSAEDVRLVLQFIGERLA